MNKGEKIFLVGRRDVHCYEYLQPHSNGHIVVKDGQKFKYVSDLWLTIAISEGFQTEKDALKTLWLQRHYDLSLLQEQAGITQRHVDAWEWYKKEGWGLELPNVGVEIDNVLKLYNEQSI
jgi:hypothetical protein